MLKLLLGAKLGSLSHNSQSLVSFKKITQQSFAKMSSKELYYGL